MPDYSRVMTLEEALQYKDTTMRYHFTVQPSKPDTFFPIIYRAIGGHELLLLPLILLVGIGLVRECARAGWLDLGASRRFSGDAPKLPASSADDAACSLPQKSRKGSTHGA